MMMQFFTEPRCIDLKTVFNRGNDIRGRIAQCHEFLLCMQYNRLHAYMVRTDTEGLVFYKIHLLMIGNNLEIQKVSKNVKQT